MTPVFGGTNQITMDAWHGDRDSCVEFSLLQRDSARALVRIAELEEIIRFRIGEEMKLWLTGPEGQELRKRCAMEADGGQG